MIKQLSIIDQLETLRYELEMYSPGLSDRPAAVVANKIDLPQAKENILSLKGTNYPDHQP